MADSGQIGLVSGPKLWLISLDVADKQSASCVNAHEHPQEYPAPLYAGDYEKDREGHAEDDENGGEQHVALDRCSLFNGPSDSRHDSSQMTARGSDTRPARVVT